LYEWEHFNKKIKVSYAKDQYLKLRQYIITNRDSRMITLYLAAH